VTKWIGFDRFHRTELKGAPLEGAKWIWFGGDGEDVGKVSRLFSKVITLPAGAKVARGIRADAAFALLFAADAAALRRRLAAAAPKLAPGAILWLGYPKLGGPVASDLSRERVWEVAKPFGLRPVAQIAVDATWSALRFKRAP